MNVSAYRGQKMIPDPLELELHVVMSRLCGCWELKANYLKEQYMYLTAEPSISVVTDWFL